MAKSIYGIENGVPPSISYTWIPQYYGKIKGEKKLLYTRSFSRSHLRFVDIDNDGDDDLFIGKGDGRIAFFDNKDNFLNQNFELETEDFKVIHEGKDEKGNPTLKKTILDVGENAAPEFVDIDGDKDLDLFIGSSDGHIFHYENRGNTLKPIFFRKTPNYMGLKFGRNSVPRFADLNGDNKYDLLVGTRSGEIKIFFNSGISKKAIFCPKFDIYEPPDIRCKYQPKTIDNISPYKNAVPEFVDWDHDKDLDLVVGKSNGKLNFYHNSGNRFSPKWDLKSSNFQFIKVGGNVSPTFHDLNRDNFPELFLGTTSSKIIYYKNKEYLKDKLSKIKTIQLEKIDTSRNNEKILSEVCNQLNGLPDCLELLASAFDVPQEIKVTNFEDLVPFTLRKDVSIYQNALNDYKPKDSPKNLKNNEKNQNIQIDNEDYNDSNSLETTSKEKLNKIKSENYEKNNKLSSEKILTRNQLWLDSNNFLNIENLGGNILFSSITSGDWNDDGKVDVLIGSESGEIFAFENRGENETDWYPISSPALRKNNRSFSQPFLVDIDGDLDLDIICGNKEGKIEWIINRGTKKNPDWKVHELNLSQIDVGSYSTPLLEDMDRDDDLDLLVGNSKGLIIYFENKGKKDSPHFELRSTRITGFQMKANSAPTFWKWNADEHPDLIVGSREGFLSLITHFPPENFPVFRGWKFETAKWQNIKSVGYSTPHFVDLDNDNKTDLVMGNKNGDLLFWKNGGFKKLDPIDENNTLILKENSLEVEKEKDEETENNIILEENLTKEDTIKNEPFDPKFEFVSNKFGNLEIGRRAFPAFIDIDGDENLDLIVGNKSGELRYYRQIKDSNYSKWSLETEHFLDYKGSGNSSPVFVDLDGDEDLDLLVGNQKGSIRYWENKGDLDLVEFVYNPSPFIGVTSGRNSIPAAIDLNYDGNKDILVGNLLGQIYKYLHIKKSNGFRFILEERNYLNIDVGLGSVPKIADLNNDNQPELIIGSDSGKISIFQIDNKKERKLLWKPAPNYFKELKLPIGGNPVFVDLDKDGDLDLIIGSQNGTLHHFRNTGF